MFVLHVIMQTEEKRKWMMEGAKQDFYHIKQTQCIQALSANVHKLFVSPFIRRNSAVSKIQIMHKQTWPENFSHFLHLLHSLQSSFRIMDMCHSRPTSAIVDALNQNTIHFPRPPIGPAPSSGIPLSYGNMPVHTQVSRSSQLLIIRSQYYTEGFDAALRTLKLLNIEKLFLFSTASVLISRCSGPILNYFVMFFCDYSSLRTLRPGSNVLTSLAFHQRLSASRPPPCCTLGLLLLLGMVSLGAVTHSHPQSSFVLPPCKVRKLHTANNKDCITALYQRLGAFVPHWLCVSNIF